MQGACATKLFTGTGFAIISTLMDERDRRINAKDILHSWRFADDVGSWATYRAFAAAAVLDKAYRPTRRGDGFIDIKRFGQIIKRVPADKR